MTAPSVAAILTTHDRPRLLADALGTVAAQRPAPAEVRIANDGALPVEDAIPALGLLEVTVLPVRVRSPGAARNRAAHGARAEVLAFLDDDDRWLPGHLAGLLAAFGDPAVGLAYRDADVVRERLEGDRRVELARRRIARHWDPEVMRRDDYIPPSAWAIRRRLFERLGGFDESFACSEDWDLLLRAASTTTPRRVPGATVEVRLRESGNLSAGRGAERRACLDRLAERHGLPRLEIKTFWEVATDVGRRAGEAGGEDG
jgi:glycosyltransferase involved in cell wall biosynthesis